MRPLIYAHRGAAGEAPENTLAAFSLAIAQGADGIELDIQMTADHQIVVIHDETLDRTTTGSGLVIQHTYEQLRQYDAGIKYSQAFAGERIPLLSEVLELLKPTNLELNIELKNGVFPYRGMEEAVIHMVRHFGMEERVIFSSFNHYSLVKMVGLAPESELAILYVAGLYEPWNYAKSIGVQSLHPHFYSVVPEIVQGAHQAGLKIRPYTVNEEKEMHRMIVAGVDAIITDYPGKMRRILDFGITK